MGNSSRLEWEHYAEYDEISKWYGSRCGLVVQYRLNVIVKMER
jgi:hypothetical protein